jgi:glucose-6-phosphate 1-dehydrogenase
MSISRSDALVVFGVTGDLAHKMIFPALYAMAKRGELTVPVVGVALPKWSMDRIHRRVTDSIKRAGGIDNKRAFRHLLSSVQYVAGDYKDPATFAAIKRALGKARRPAFYLAIPPVLFESVIQVPRHLKIVRERPRHCRESPSVATSPRRASSIASPAPFSLKIRSSASITSSARKRS